jgi:glycosyltransferase involved in cell wall biosynthesis
LVQVITGTPAIGYVARDVESPMCLQVATTARLERKHGLRTATLPRRLIGRVMLPIVEGVERKAINLAQHVFADTEYTANALAAAVPRDRVTVDTIGVDTSVFAPAETRADNYILCVGRLNDPRKNVPLLFEAYARLACLVSDPPALVLAGITGPTRADWNHAAALGIQDKVKFCASPSLERLVALYRNAAMLVLSSAEEGLGIVLLEALACETPVVSTRCGGPEFVVTPDVGVLTPLGDAAALAEAMAELWQSPSTRRTLGEAGRRMILARFCHQVVGQKFLSVYDRLLAIASDDSATLAAGTSQSL